MCLSSRYQLQRMLSVSLALLLNCPAVKSYARLLQVEAKGDEVKRLALAGRAAEGTAAVSKSLYLRGQHPEIPREYALLAFCAIKAFKF